jgi:hypothetical protein
MEAGRVAQAEEHLSTKRKALSSNPSATKKPKKALVWRKLKFPGLRAPVICRHTAHICIFIPYAVVSLHVLGVLHG